MPAFLSGLLRGFGTTAAAEREAARKRQESQDDREYKILNYLATVDDPGVQGAAITGLLDLAAGTKRPKGGFLARLMGPAEVTTHPAVGNLLQMIRAGREERVGDLPIRELEFLPPPPPGPAASRSAGAPVAGAVQDSATPAPPAPPPAAPPTLPLPQIAPPGTIPAGLTAAMAPPPSVAAPPAPGMLPSPSGVPSGSPSAAAAPPPQGSPPPPPPDMTLPMGGGVRPGKQVGVAPGTTRRVPIKLFDTAEEKALKQARAKAQGDVEGDFAGLVAAGFSEQEARTMIKEDRARRMTGAGSPFQSIPGELPDGTPAFGVFNRFTGDYEDPVTNQPLIGFRPRTTTGSTSFGAEREAISRLPQFGGKPYAQLTPMQRIAVDNEVRRRVGETAYNRTMGAANAGAERPFTVQEAFTNEQQLRDRLFSYTEMAQRTLTLAGAAEEAATQFASNLQEGLPLSAQTEVIISNFKRITDELSAVRNEEYNRSMEQRSLMQRWEGWLQNITQGGSLTQVGVDNIMQVVRAIVANRKEAIRGEVQTTYNAGVSRGFAPERFLTPQLRELIGVQGGGTGSDPRVGTLVRPEYLGTDVVREINGRYFVKIGDVITELVKVGEKYYYK